MSFLENICLFSPDENEITKWLNNINTSSEQINKAINIIKKDLENPNCEKRDESEKRLEQLIETATLFEKYKIILSQKKENESSESYKNLKDLFNAVSLNVDKLDKLNSEIRRFMNNVRNKVNLIIENKIEIKKEVIIDKEEGNKNIEKLFNKYFSKKGVQNRWEINSIEFTKKLYNAIDRWEINQSEKQKILQHWYYLAFKSETKSKEWKKWIENIKKYENRWRNIFYNELKDVIKSKETAQNLFLLSWIEWNWKDQPKNSFGASWWFQILLSTAKNVIPWTAEKDLHDPIKSAKIAAKYIKILITNEKEKNPDLDENNIIQKAITKYNWNFSSRLLDSKKKDISKTIYELFKDLNWIKTLINKKDSKTNTIKQIKDKLDQVHDKYYKHSWDWNWTFSWTSHFWILEKNTISKQSVVKWINNYLKSILKQQDMYPIQFNAINKLYNEQKKAN